MYNGRVNRYQNRMTLGLSLFVRHDIKSEVPEERLRANIELAQIMRKQFDDLLSKIEFHSKKNGC